MLGFTRMLLWTHQDFESDPLYTKNKMRWAALQNKSLCTLICRPFCAAFKPLVLWRALVQSSDEAYVVWLDADMLHQPQNLSGLNIGLVITSLRHRRWDPPACMSASLVAPTLDSIYGIMHCAFQIDCSGSLLCMRNQDNYNVNAATLSGFGELVRRPETFSEQAHLHNSAIVLSNTEVNRNFTLQWLNMALENPHAFCSSHTQDQAAFTILVGHNAFPVLNTCARFAASHGRCPQTWAMEDFFRPIQENVFDVVSSFGPLPCQKTPCLPK